MNKYQEAFERTKQVVTIDTLDDFITLKELVEKATPKKLDSLYYKVHKKYDEYYVSGYCVVCGNEFHISKDSRPNYCPNCGQKIDWGNV